MMASDNDELRLRDIEMAWSHVLRRRSNIFAAGDSESTGCFSASSSPPPLVANAGNDGKTPLGSSASQSLHDLLNGQHIVSSAYATATPFGSAGEDLDPSNQGDIRRAEGLPQAGTSTSGKTGSANEHTVTTNECIEPDLSFGARVFGDAAQEPSSFEENTDHGVQAACSAAPEPPRDRSTPIIKDKHAKTRASVAASLDGATTIVVQNLSKSMFQDALAQVVACLGFADKYDYLYLPVIFETGKARGYAFVNFLTAEIAVDFVILSRRQGLRCKRASVQGISSYVESRTMRRAMNRVRNQSFQPFIRTNASETQGHTVPEHISQANIQSCSRTSACPDDDGL
eukprot:TRINITY_DN2453_c0_g2_i1.p1 TRINITY_DN2453_c0_g2~~TRINITY_DN2453_c0_g2_i1.p1  ORF type:complete len:343 (+),score=42.19 TRINITY_DN2453_c0_g2_i1:52-1080(+)